MIADLIRPVWTWVLWSRRRLTFTLCMLAALSIAGARLAHGTPSRIPAHDSPATPPPAVSTGRPASPRTAAPAGGPGLVWAIFTGQQFAAAWVSQAPGWRAQASRYATPALAAQLAAGTPGPAHVAAVTGPAAVAAQAGHSVTLTVPTTAGVAWITVVRAGAGWLTSAAHLTHSGG